MKPIRRVGELILVIDRHEQEIWVPASGNDTKLSKSLNYYIRGPIPLIWIEQACQCPASTLRVALLLLFLQGLFKREAISIGAKWLSIFRLDRSGLSRGLRHLEEKGLIHIERTPGRRRRITICEPGNKDRIPLK